MLVLVGALGLLIDGFAERRAEPYTKALVELSGKHGAAEDSSPRPALHSSSPSETEVG